MVMTHGFELGPERLASNHIPVGHKRFVPARSGVRRKNIVLRYHHAVGIMCCRRASSHLSPMRKAAIGAGLLYLHKVSVLILLK
jgi:hypothetical protein